MRPLFVFLLLIFSTTAATAALATPAEEPVPIETMTTTFDRKSVEARLGRKLRFSERIVLGVMKRKAKRRARSGKRSGPMDALALTSFGLGLLTIISSFTGITALFVFFGLGAIVSGIIALVNLGGKSDYKRGRGFAIAGIVTPVAWLALVFLFVVLFFFN